MSQPRARQISLKGEIGFDVTRVSSGQQALGTLTSAEAFRLVFSDTMMPGGMNGIQLAQAIKERQHEVAILLTSGFASGFSEKALLKIDILAKPFNLQQLEQSLLSVVNSSDILQL